MSQSTFGTRMKTTLRVISLLIATIFLITIPAGCISNVVEINLRADGTSQMGFIIGISKQTITLIENEAKNKRLVENWPESLMEKAKKQEGGAQIGGGSKANSQGTTKSNPQNGSASNSPKTSNPPPPASTAEKAEAKNPQAAMGDNYKILLTTIDDVIKKSREAATKEGFKCEDFDNKDIKGFKAIKDFKTFEEIKNLGSATKGATEDAAALFSKFANGISIKKEQGQTELNINVDMTNELNTINGQLAQLSKTVGIKSEILDGYKAEFRVKLFKKAESQNATTVEADGKTLVWDLKKNKKMEMKFIIPPPKVAQEGSGGLLALLLIIPVILIIAFLLFIIIRKRRAASPGRANMGMKSGGKKQEDKWNL